MKPTLKVTDAIEHLLTAARAHKIDLEVLVNDRRSTGISFQQRKLEQFSRSETCQLGVRVLDGKNEGIAFSERLDRESLDQLLADAKANARMIQREWVSELHHEKELPQLPGIFNANLEGVALEEKIKTAQKLEASAYEHDSRITNVVYAKYGDSSAQVWMANSRGLLGSYKVNSCYVFTRCMAIDGSANVMSGDVNVQREFRSLSPEKIAKSAAEKTLHRIGAVRPATGRYTVVFENRVAEDLVDLLSSYFSAKSVDEKTSPLTGKLKQNIFSPKFTLTDDPFLTDALASRPFDDEGYPSRKTVLVKDGVVETFLTNSVLARKLGLAHTASASRAPSSDLGISSSNLVVAPGQASLDELLNSDRKVLLITELLGQAGFRRSSADFSMPFEGHLYENGKPSVAVKDFLISGNLLDVFKNIETVGNDCRPPVGATVCPSLLVPNLNVAGQA